jgi:queuine/archaeosine tRNA-ribosyltransferase
VDDFAEDEAPVEFKKMCLTFERRREKLRSVVRCEWKNRNMNFKDNNLSGSVREVGEQKESLSWRGILVE